MAEGRTLGAPANLDEWDLYIDGENAAQCHNAFGENYVRGARHDAVHTEWLGVAERFRGRGLARAMLRLGMVRAWDRGSRVATLTTAGINFRAQALYITEGYAQTDTMWTSTSHTDGHRGCPWHASTPVIARNEPGQPPGRPPCDHRGHPRTRTRADHEDREAVGVGTIHVIKTDGSINPCCHESVAGPSDG